MLEGLYIASSGAVKQQRKLEVLSNNLANISTTGYKQNGLVFQEMIPPFSQSASSIPTSSKRATSVGEPSVAYVGIAQFTTDLSQGALVSTNNELDLAIDGPGFFAINTPQGTRYTRKGAFKLDSNGTLMTKEGHPVQSEQGDPIAIPPGSGKITVDNQGTISAGSGTTIFPMGKLKLVNFDNPGNLIKEGESLFKPANSKTNPNPIEGTKIVQGFVESSNVNAIEEMTRMIGTVRLFEVYQRTIQSIDEADDQSVNNLARVV